MNRVPLAFLWSFGSALAASGCVDDFKSCDETNSCAGNGGDAGIGGDAGPGGNGDGATAATGATGAAGAGECDGARSPVVEPCRVTDESAVFVAPNGDDLGTGTRAEPLASFAEAVARAVSEGKFVVACAGSYGENLALSGSTAVEVYGGFRCADWLPGGGATLIAPERGVPLTLTRVTGAVRFENVELRAPDARDPGESSIAASIVRSEDVTLVDVTLRAGNGADGADGATMEYEHPPAAALDGKSATGTYGGARCAETCPNGDLPIGGRGGDGAAAAARMEPGEAGLPASDAGFGAGGVAAAACSGTGSGGAGETPPVNGARAGAGASSMGVMRGTSWVPAGGEPGADGLPGQGGGGGRGGDNGGGGGGACGGCGGKGGAPGQGGGGSIALLAYQSMIRLEGSTLVTGRGGEGGDGAPGQAGQAGGSGGAPYTATACAGGDGGDGAAGAPGGGGAGGISVGVLLVGAEPQGDEASYDLGAAGPGGAGGAVGDNDGMPGLREHVFTLE